MGIEQIITYLTPFIVFAVAWLVGKFKPLIPGWAMLGVVGLLTSLTTWITNLIGNPDLDWIYQLLYGLLAVVLSQLVKQLSPSKVSTDNAKLKK